MNDNALIAACRKQICYRYHITYSNTHSITCTQDLRSSLNVSIDRLYIFRRRVSVSCCDIHSTHFRLIDRPHSHIHSLSGIQFDIGFVTAVRDIFDGATDRSFDRSVAGRFAITFHAYHSNAYSYAYEWSCDVLQWECENTHITCSLTQQCFDWLIDMHSTIVTHTHLHIVLIGLIIAHSAHSTHIVLCISIGQSKHCE
jgi:hypothetical protein